MFRLLYCCVKGLAAATLRSSKACLSTGPLVVLLGFNYLVYRQSKRCPLLMIMADSIVSLYCLALVVAIMLCCASWQLRLYKLPHHNGVRYKVLSLQATAQLSEHSST